MIELVEMEIRETLTNMGFDGANTPIVKGSALYALDDKDPEIGKFDFELNKICPIAEEKFTHLLQLAFNLVLVMAPQII